jgi:hypothetical protein
MLKFFFPESKPCQNAVNASVKQGQYSKFFDDTCGYRFALDGSINDVV